MKLRVSRPLFPDQDGPARLAAPPAADRDGYRQGGGSRESQAQAAGLRRPANRRAAVAPVRAPPCREPRSYLGRGRDARSPDRRGL